jgi:hypothetical protein
LPEGLPAAGPLCQSTTPPEELLLLELPELLLELLLLELLLLELLPPPPPPPHAQQSTLTSATTDFCKLFTAPPEEGAEPSRPGVPGPLSQLIDRIPHVFVKFMWPPFADT